MSYCRFSNESDVYMYRHVDGFIRCCSCKLTAKDPALNTEREALNHLDEHKRFGHRVPQYAIDRLIDESKRSTFNKYITIILLALYIISPVILLIGLYFYLISG